MQRSKFTCLRVWGKGFIQARLAAAAGGDYSSGMDDNAEFVAEPLVPTPPGRDRVLLFDRDFNLCARADGGFWWSREDLGGRIRSGVWGISVS